MKNPKAKIIQIAFNPNTGDLFALDRNGVIWRRDESQITLVWRKQIDNRGGKK